MQQSLTNQAATPVSSNDYHVIPATEKQVRFARHIALNARVELPADLIADRRRLSQWIDEHHKQPNPSPFSSYPSSRQVAFAERIARLKRRDVPRACFRDKMLMSRWIDNGSVAKFGKLRIHS